MEIYYYSLDCGKEKSRYYHEEVDGVEVVPYGWRKRDMDYRKSPWYYEYEEGLLKVSISSDQPIDNPKEVLKKLATEWYTDRACEYVRACQQAIARIEVC